MANLCRPRFHRSLLNAQADIQRRVTFVKYAVARRSSDVTRKATSNNLSSTLIAAWHVTDVKN